MPSNNSPFKSNVLNPKVALVTGGTAGIGFEIARQLGLHGAKVAVAGRRKDVMAGAVAALQAEGIEAMGLMGDVRSPETAGSWVSQVVEQWGHLDCLVNCAAGNFLAAAEELSVNGFKTVMDIDATGTFNVSRAAFKALAASKDAVIINISATLHYGATRYQVHASAAKAAVDSITRTLALEWGGDGVRVNAVAPGPIEGTAGMAKLAPSTGGSASDMKAKVVEAIPVGRMGTPWDIAMACVFLASPAGSFISGHVMVVDGGNWMWRPAIVPRQAVSQVSRKIETVSREVGTVSKL